MVNGWSMSPAFVTRLTSSTVSRRARRASLSTTSSRRTFQKIQGTAHKIPKRLATRVTRETAIDERQVIAGEQHPGHRQSIGESDVYS